MSNRKRVFRVKKGMDGYWLCELIHLGYRQCNYEYIRKFKTRAEAEAAKEEKKAEAERYEQ